MGFVIGYLIACFLVALTGHDKKIGYWGVFIISLFLSPFIGLIVGVTSKVKEAK